MVFVVGYFGKADEGVIFAAQNYQSNTHTIMKPNTIKATIAMTEFFTFNTTPEELSEVLHRASILEDNNRDREIMSALSRDLAHALGM